MDSIFVANMPTSGALANEAMLVAKVDVHISEATKLPKNKRNGNVKQTVAAKLHAKRRCRSGQRLNL